jgi:hypothetical protein
MSHYAERPLDNPAPMTGAHPLPSTLSVTQLRDRADAYFEQAETCSAPDLRASLERLGRRFAALAEAWNGEVVTVLEEVVEVASVGVVSVADTEIVAVELSLVPC